MNTCLRKRTLLLLSAGEGTNKQRAHLATCVSCATRYRRFVHELEGIEQTLRETSPPPAVSPRLLPMRWRWRPVAAAFAATLALIWGGLWLRQPSLPPASMAARTEDLSLLLENELSPALFSTVDASAAETQEPVPPVAYVQAALEEDWPCEWQDPFFDSGCDDHSFPLLFEGQ